jgi:hypothetical protein
MRTQYDNDMHCIRCAGNEIQLEIRLKPEASGIRPESAACTRKYPMYLPLNSFDSYASLAKFWSPVVRH